MPRSRRLSTSCAAHFPSNAPARKEPKKALGPSEGLAALTEEVAELLQAAQSELLLQALGPDDLDAISFEVPTGFAALFAKGGGLGSLDRVVGLPSGRSATAGDLLAALAYARLGR